MDRLEPNEPFGIKIPQLESISNRYGYRNFSNYILTDVKWKIFDFDKLTSENIRSYMNYTAIGITISFLLQFKIESPWSNVES